VLKAQFLGQGFFLRQKGGFYLLPGSILQTDRVLDVSKIKK